MTQPMDNLVQKCAVQGCTNHKHEGLFVGLLCSPCHRFISTGDGVYSWACRNMREYAERAVEAARAEEREACAKICDLETALWEENSDGQVSLRCVAAVIRARGKE